MWWLNRTLCNVLEEMRKAHETRNYSYLDGLIEEAQSMANKMESGLGDKSDFQEMLKKKAELKKEIEALEKEKADGKKE